MGYTMYNPLYYSLLCVIVPDEPLTILTRFYIEFSVTAGLIFVFQNVTNL